MDMMSIAVAKTMVNSTVEEIKEQFGAPLVANAASGMTDQDRVYVYTGNETGFSSGHWYYYNGSNWTDGGVYNAVAVETDDTLSVSGKAADGKAVGDELVSIKNDLLQLTPWAHYSDVYDTFGNLYKDSYNKITDRYDTIKSVIIPLVSGYTYIFKAIGAFNRFGLCGCDGNQIGDTVYPAICFYEGTLTNKEYTYSNQDGYPYLLVLLAYNYDAFTCELEVIREHGTVGDIFSVNGVQVPTKEQEEADISNAVNNSSLSELEDVLGFNALQWEMGGINADHGTDLTGDTRIRTNGYIDSSIKSVSAASGYYVMLYTYNSDNSYNGIWNPSTGTFVKSLTTSVSVDITQIPSYQTYKYRLVLRKTDNATITLDTASNVSYFPVSALDAIEAHVDSVESAFNGITSWKEKFDGTFVNLYKSDDNIAENSGARSAIVPIISGATYEIVATGTFNRFGIYGCGGCNVGSSATTITFSNGSFTDKSYEYVSDGTYSYLLVLLAYGYDQFSAELSIKEFTGSVVNKFKINGVEVVTAEQLSEVEDDIDALGQTITGISTDINNIYDAIGNFIPSSEIGGIDAGWGNNVTNSARIRTEYINESITNISAETGYYIILYAYNLDGTYKGVWDAPNNRFITNLVTLTSVDITTIPSYQAYRYRVVLRRVDNGSMTIDEAPNMIFYPINNMDKLENDFENVVENLDSLLPGYKSTSYYSADDTQLLVPTYAGVIALYDELVSAYSAYVTKNTLTSGNFSNYEYVFSMGSRNNGTGQRTEDAEIEKPVVLIMSGVHGYERCSVMGLYLFAKALCEDPTMSTLRSGLTVKIIPIVCPWGYDNNSRINSNGVNINRNFDADWVQTSTGQDYSGAAPADQPETQVVQDWMDSNTDAVLALDWHNSAYTNEISYLATNSSTGFAPNVKKAYFFGIDHIVGRLSVERGINGSSIIYGYTGYENAAGHSDAYGAKIGIDTCLVETSWNVGNYGKDSASTIGVNAEAFCAIMRGIMEKYIDNL